MSEYTGLDKAVLFHEQNCTFSACAGHDARAELATLRARVSELEAEQANQADSLRHWSDLWNHIVTRLGSVDELPTTANFDALLLPWALD